MFAALTVILLILMFTGNLLSNVSSTILIIKIALILNLNL